MTPEHPTGRIAATLGRLRPLTVSWRPWALAVAIGTVPFLVAWLFHLPGSHLVAGALLPLLMLPLVWQGRWPTALGVVAVAFTAHNAQTMLLTWVDPEGVGALSPAFTDYLARQERWIMTGSDPEYELANWLPAHLRLCAVAIPAAMLTLGALIYIQGFFEVDLMNYYTARIMTRSHEPLATFAWGWHIWSVMRGIGFLLVAQEGVWVMLAWLTRRPMALGEGGGWRLAIGLGFLAGDALVKWLLLDATRNHLAAQIG